jgi:hypothetical protein
MQKRRRFKQAHSLDQRLANESARLRQEADSLPPSADRDHLIRQARQTDTASHMSDWLNSPGLRSPS